MNLLVLKMKAKFVLIVIIVIIIFFLSCGVIIDSSKLIGKWNLSEVNFYVYNETVDSYKKISGKNDLTPDDSTPIIGNFFFEKKKDIVIEFFSNNKFTLKGINSNGTEENIIDATKPGEWIVDNFENSITFKVDKIDPNSQNLWKRGVSIKNYWPVISNTAFKIYVKASDFNIQRFTFDLSGDKTIEIYSMEAFFKKR